MLTISVHVSYILPLLLLHHVLTISNHTNTHFGNACETICGLPHASLSKKPKSPGSMKAESSKSKGSLESFKVLQV